MTLTLKRFEPLGSHSPATVSKGHGSQGGKRPNDSAKAWKRDALMRYFLVVPLRGFLFLCLVRDTKGVTQPHATLRRVLRRFFKRKCFLEGFLEGVL